MAKGKSTAQNIKNTFGVRKKGKAIKHLNKHLKTKRVR
jgi:hypothetical protein